MHLLACFKQNVKGWRMMVLPVETRDLIVEFSCIIWATTHIEDLEAIAVSLLEETHNLRENI